MKKSISRFWTRVLPWIAQVHSVLFVLFWLTNPLFYDSVNTYLIGKIGMRLDYVSICLIFALLVASGTFLVLVSRRQKVKRGWAALVAALSVFFVVFFYGSFFVLFKQDPAQPVRLWRMLRYNGLYFYGLLLAVFVLLFVAFFQPFMKKFKGTGKAGAAHVIIDSILLFGLLWSAGLWVPPTSVVRGELPDKPLIISDARGGCAGTGEYHLLGGTGSGIGRKRGGGGYPHQQGRGAVPNARETCRARRMGYNDPGT